MSNAAKHNARRVAVGWLQQVISQGKSIQQIMQQQSTPLSAREQALAKQLLFGCTRYFFALKLIIENLLEKPLKAKDDDVFIVLLIGIYQLKYLAIPDHAAISESVELTKKIKKSWASGLVNGLLRNFQRNQQALDNQLATSKRYQFAHPVWMIDQLHDDWPDDYQQILKQNNQQAAMIIRVNTLKISLNDYQKKLQAQGISSQTHPFARDALVLAQAVEVKQLPGFFDGQVTVQDAAAQLAVEFLDLQAGQNVLDACAAPGGKTTHILQREKHLKLTAVEISANRCAHLKDNLQRLDFLRDANCQVITGDLLDYKAWWDGHLYDRILLDAPCSASGVIRRNPDIKIHRKPSDLNNLLKLQSAMLQTSWQLLKPGGIILYATCSVFQQENTRQIKTLIEKIAPQAEEVLINLLTKFKKRTNYGYQIFPGEDEMDGFYFCALKKPAFQAE